MGIIICIKQKGNIRILHIGNISKYLTMVASICKNISEKIAIEKNISVDQAMRFLLKSITDVKDVIN